MINTISILAGRTRELETRHIVGRVSSVVGLVLTVVGIERAIGIGQRCSVRGAKDVVTGEVVGIDQHGVHVLPFGTWSGVSVGDEVSIISFGDTIRPDKSWIGRVLNALGNPLDGKGSLPQGDTAFRINAQPPPALCRKRIGERLETGIKIFNVFTPLCRGQRLGVFSGSGVGKSMLTAMLARMVDADVIVVGLIGERGREVQDFITRDLGPEGLAKSVIIVSTSDEPPLMRRQAAWTATAVAEYFRDKGLHVLLLMDSVTRFAMAQREIGLSSGEPPTSKGYPPTVFSELPRLIERAGPGVEKSGDITAVYAVLVDGDDMNEPVADAVRGIADGHIILSRSIAERGRFPAVDINKSVSRMLPDCHSEAELAIYQTARTILAKYNDMEELIQIGAYRKGTDEEIDAAIKFFKPAETFLAQTLTERVSASHTFQKLSELIREARGKTEA